MGLFAWVDHKLRKEVLPPLFALWNGEFMGSKMGAATEAMYAHDGTFIKETTAGMDFYNHAKTYTGFALGTLVAVGLPVLYFLLSEAYRVYRFRQFNALSEVNSNALKETGNAEKLRYWLRGDLDIFNILIKKDGFEDQIWQLLSDLQKNKAMGRSVAERVLTLVNGNVGLLYTVLGTYKKKLQAHFKDNPKEPWILLELVQGNLFLRAVAAHFFKDWQPPDDQKMQEDKGYFYELNYVRRPFWWPADFHVPWDARMILGPGGGGLIGATLGTFVAPGLGAAIGYLIGAAFGFLIAFGRDEFFPRLRAFLIHRYYEMHDNPPAFKARRKWYRESNVDLPLYAHWFPAAMAGMGLGVAYGALGALCGVIGGVLLFSVLPYLWSAWRAMFVLDETVEDKPPLVRKAVKMAWWRRSYWDMPATYRYSFGVMMGTMLGVVFPSSLLMAVWTALLGFAVGPVMAGGFTGGLLALASPMMLDVVIQPVMKRTHDPVTWLTQRWQLLCAGWLGLEIKKDQLKKDNEWVTPDIPWYITLAPASVATFALCTALGVSTAWGLGALLVVGLLHPALERVVEPFFIKLRTKLAIEYSDTIAWSLRMMGFQSIFAVTCTIVGANVPAGVIAGALFGLFYPYIVGMLRTFWRAVTPERTSASAVLDCCDEQAAVCPPLLNLDKDSVKPAAMISASNPLQSVTASIYPVNFFMDPIQQQSLETVVGFENGVLSTPDELLAELEPTGSCQTL